MQNRKVDFVLILNFNVIIIIAYRENKQNLL
jgi:hypothetical protein